MHEIFDHLLMPASISAFLQVVMIDLVLAADNAVVVGMAAAGLARQDRAKAILVGIACATVLRIAFALGASYLLSIIGLLLAGGLLLLWVCWKMWRELKEQPAQDDHDDATGPRRKSFAQAIKHIIIADVSMSLDNVLAVAGAAHEHPMVLVFGLCLSVVLMGFAASAIAGLLTRYRWIAYVGLAVILFVAGEMIWRGAMEVAYAVQ
ncbi:TerC family protein [Rhizobium halophytocola]|uniref:YjbE family integral membrane protein n=1 Tax=Rhizobium halophytocola TaxID=735519 RepID=A0ABS4DU27_9HYPH|nr:TerC family protein [Rhizobium halophytocola]MBP1849172.1 YjbE family integral membrane protein [Rhizobium halophytocola]